MEITDMAIKTRTEELKNEGVAFDDVKNWLEMGDDKRKDVMAFVHAQSLTFFQWIVETEKMSPQEALYKVAKILPCYSDYPIEQGYLDEMKRKPEFSINDYPLPWELCARVGKAAMFKFAPNGKENFQNEVKQFSSVNAFLRDKIQKKEI